MLNRTSSKPGLPLATYHLRVTTEPYFGVAIRSRICTSYYKTRYSHAMPSGAAVIDPSFLLIYCWFKPRNRSECNGCGIPALSPAVSSLRSKFLQENSYYEDRTDSVAFHYTVPSCCSWDFWWKTNVTPLFQAPLSRVSSSPFRSAQWFHWDKAAVQSAPSGGGWTWMLFTHRLHLNLEKPIAFCQCYGKQQQSFYDDDGKVDERAIK